MAGRNSQRRVDLTERLERKEPRKLLAIDGGGAATPLGSLTPAEAPLCARGGRNDCRISPDAIYRGPGRGR